MEKKNDSNELVKGVEKINDGLYVGKKGDLYFVLERVTKENIRFWENYSETQERKTRRMGLGGKHGNDAIRSFQHALKFWNSNQVWIAYATAKKITKESVNSSLQEEDDIELSFTVMTDKDIPFSTHMGIFRGAEFWGDKAHKNVSMDLHSFAAKAIKLAYGNKDYMITRPVDIMRKIMLKTLPKDAAWIGDAQELEKIRKQKKFIPSFHKNQLSNIDVYEFEKLFSVSLNLEKLFKKIEIVKTAMKDQDKSYMLDDAVKKQLEEVDEKNISKDEAEKLRQDILEKNIKDIEAKIRDSITQKDIESSVDYVIYKSDKFFPNGDNGYISPLSIEKDKDSKVQLTITKLNGEKVTFELPEFYKHEHLYDFGMLPTVIIKLDTLAGLLKLDA